VEEAAVSSAEENLALARRFMEARVVKRDLDAVAEMLAPDFVNRNKLLPGQKPGREDYLRGIAAFHAALSEGRLIIEDQVAGGDKVVTRFVVHSPHDRGELMGVAPTGRVLTNRAIVIHRIVEGKIAEEWGMGTIGGTLRKQRLEQEISERERIEQELKVAHPASLTPQGGASTGGLADHSLLPTRYGGRRRLLRLLRAR
jgi:predicted ester cyclase